MTYSSYRLCPLNRMNCTYSSPGREANTTTAATFSRKMRLCGWNSTAGSSAAATVASSAEA